MKRNLPTFAAIRAFEAAARRGSIQIASEELRLTPSAISHQVKALEAFLGTALFEREPGRLTLTKEGAAYHEDLQQVLDLLDAATARASHRGNSTHITIHMYYSLSELWFAPMLKEFHRDHPDIQISVVSDPLADDFATGIADVSIVYDRVPESGDDCFLFADEIVPCCSEAFLQQHGPIETPEAILELPLIWCDAAPEDWTTWCRYAGLEDPGLRQWIGFDLQAAVLQAAREGVGIAMSHTPYQNLASARPRLVRPVDLVAPTGFGYRLAVAQRAEHLEKIKIFTSWLTRASREAPWRDK